MDSQEVFHPGIEQPPELLKLQHGAFGPLAAMALLAPLLTFQGF